MNNYSFKQYNDGLTRLVEESNDYIVGQLKSMVEKENYDNLLDYLNDPENLITPALILKRRIQEVYPDVLEEGAVSLGLEINDLTESDAAYWTYDEDDENRLVMKLAELLPERILKDTSVEWLRFENYILGTTMPMKRDIILMLASAFQMDEITLAKFLLSCSKHELNVYNPMDYIYLFCLRRQKDEPVQWAKVTELLKRYEDGVEAAEEVAQAVGNAKAGSNVEKNTAHGSDDKEGSTSWTYLLSDKLSEITGSTDLKTKLDSNVSEDELIDFMVLNRDKFTSILYRKRTNTKGLKVESKKGQYIEGASRTRRLDLYELTRVLVNIYPSYSVYSLKNKKELKGGGASEDIRTVKVNVDANGYPNLSKLVKSMTAAHDWDFLSDDIDPDANIKIHEHKDGRIGLARTQNKITYDNEPFRKYVYLYCKGFNAKIRKIKNIDTGFQNTEPIDRQDILYMGYMFISGFVMMSEDEQDELCDKIQDLYGRNLFVQKLIYIMERLMDIEDNALDEYQKCLTLFLNAFGFGELYLPFVFDRFVLLALLGERESGDITWTRDLMEEGYWGDIDKLADEE